MSPLGLPWLRITSLIRRPRKKSKIVLFTSILELISNELQNEKGSITNIKILFAGTSKNVS